MVKYLKLLFRGRKVVNTLLSEKDKVQNVYEKSSLKSSEFVIAVLSGLGAVATQAAGIIPPPYGAIVAASAAALYAISRGMVKHSDPLGGSKPGLTTTEFSATMLAQVAAVATAVAGATDPKTAAILIAVSQGAYAISRGLAKTGAQPAAK